MVSFFYIVKGFTIGFAIAAPIGPIGLLCIRKTLEMGFLGALSVGAGATLANGIYGFVAGMGLTALSGVLLEGAKWIRLVGGFFLMYLSWREFNSASSCVTSVDSSRNGFLKLSSQAFFMTMTCPLAIVGFLGVFASLSSGVALETHEALLMILGIVLGSISWWMVLGYGVSKAQGYLSKAWINRIRYISAGIIAWFGIMALVGALRMFY